MKKQNNCILLFENKSFLPAMASKHQTRNGNICSTSKRPSLAPLIMPTYPTVPYFEQSNYIKYPSRITSFMFLGDSKDSKNHKFIDDNGITHILNVTKDEPNWFEDEGRIKYMRISILDTVNQNIATHFDTAHEFIERARLSGGKILIHCYAGISRSATIVISYLIKTRHLNAETAYQMVKIRRPIVSPNISFYSTLINYYIELTKTHGFVHTPIASPLASPAISPLASPLVSSISV